MRFNKNPVISGVAVIATAVGISVIGGGAADASQPQPRSASAVAPANSCNSACIIDGNVWQSDMAPAFVKALYGVYNNTVTSPSVKDGSLGLADFSTAALDGLKGKDGTNGVDGKSAYEIAKAGGYTGTEAAWLDSLKGAKGDTGEQGPKGDTGLTGPQGPAGTNGKDGVDGTNGADGKPGVTNLESDSPYPGATQLADNPGNGANSTAKFVGGKPNELQRAWVQCADGKTAIGGGFQRGDEGAAAIKNLQIVTSSPVQIKGGAEVYEPIAGDTAGSVKPNAWLVEGFNNGDTDLIVRPSVICANVG